MDFVPNGYPPHPLTGLSAIDVHLPLGDLPRLLRRGIDAFPARTAYLRAAPDRAAHWRRGIDALGPRPQIGICWRSSNLRGVRALACSQLSPWNDVLRAVPAEWISLQYDECGEELDRSHAASGVEIRHFPQIATYRDLDDTAALIGCLGLVISAPTSVSYLNAALVIPTWQLSSGATWQTLRRPGLPWLRALRYFHRP